MMIRMHFHREKGDGKAREAGNGMRRVERRKEVAVEKETGECYGSGKTNADPQTFSRWMEGCV